MNIPEIDYTDYARLLISTGVSLPRGGNLRIRHNPTGVLLARRCAEIAYERGAGIVHIEAADPHIGKARIKAQDGSPESLGAVPGWTEAWETTVLEEQWSFLALQSFDDVGLMADVNPQAMAMFDKLQMEKIKRYRESTMAHHFAWCLAAVPSDTWARRVLGEGRNAFDLWETLKPILRLDTPDPSAAWLKAAENLERRRKALDDMNLHTLHFEDDGTDLRVGLLKRSRWMGGGHSLEGRRTMPNIPTEEVFTTPDRTRCEGRVRTRRPVEVRGTIVKDASLEFRNGVVTDFDASEGRDALAAFLDTDEGSRRLGEAALVDEESPAAKSGLIFGSVLFDENASCHIALGAGYPTCLDGGDELQGDEAKIAAGCSCSGVHRDFMIGSPSTRVTGIRADGGTVPIMHNGSFVI